MNIFWCLYASVIVNWNSLSCGQNEAFEDVILGSVKFEFSPFSDILLDKQPWIDEENNRRIHQKWKYLLLVALDEAKS